MKPTVLCVLIVLLSITCSGWTQEGRSASDASKKQEAAAKESPELAAVRAECEAFTEAFNKADAKAVAALWTREGEYIDEAGERFAGRDEIEKVYAEYFAGNPQGRIKIEIDSLRKLSDQIVVEEGRSTSEPASAERPGYCRYTAIHTKEDGRWKLASVRDTWVEVSLAQRNLSDLDFLIGTWEAEEHGVKLESVFRWVANNTFIERQYTNTHLDGTQTSGIQLIGWNAERAQVQSWNFSPDGGHAVGFWTPQENGWVARMHGLTGDGVATGSINSIVRLDDNAYVWKSVDRTLGDLQLPDSDEVILKRK